VVWKEERRKVRRESEAKEKEGGQNEGPPGSRAYEFLGQILFIILLCVRYESLYMGTDEKMEGRVE